MGVLYPCHTDSDNVSFYDTAGGSVYNGTVFVSQFSMQSPQDSTNVPCIFLLFGVCIGLRFVPVPGEFFVSLDGWAAAVACFDRRFGERTAVTFSVFCVCGFFALALAAVFHCDVEGFLSFLCILLCSVCLWSWRLAGTHASDVQRLDDAARNVAVLAELSGRSNGCSVVRLHDDTVAHRMRGLFYYFALWGFTINSERVRFADSCWI